MYILTLSWAGLKAIAYMHTRGTLKVVIHKMYTVDTLFHSTLFSLLLLHVGSVKRFET